MGAVVGAQEEATLAQNETAGTFETLQSLQAEVVTLKTEVDQAKEEVVAAEVKVAELTKANEALQAAADEASEVANSGEAVQLLSLKYFQTLALLIKVQLANQSPEALGNEPIDESLLEEMRKAKIGYDEWPAFLFSRVFV